jgi:flagellar hook-length control protein FliK
MSIETGGIATSQKAVTGAENHAAKGKCKAKAGGEPDAVAGGGFAALLTSVESATDGSVGGMEEADGLQATATALPIAVSVSLVLPPAEAAIAASQDMSTDLAMLLAQAGQVAADKEAALGDGRAIGKSGVGLQSTAALSGEMQGILTAAAVASADGGNAVDFQQNVDALLDGVAHPSSGHSVKMGAVESRAAAAELLAESRTAKFALLADAASLESATVGSVASSGLGDGYLRQTERSSPKSSASPVGAGVESIWGSHALLTGSRVDAPSVIADPSMRSLESTVANTVSYWVTQGIQNAELKLEGFGGETVEVHISLKGDEARVDFRTDQPEIRQVLEGAVAHLKDLLANEGLVLSGVSVGASGQNGAGAQQERKNSPDARAVTIATTDVARIEVRQRVNPAVGQALDIFV